MKDEDNSKVIIELIPEYLNGNLSDDDIAIVESAAKEDEFIRMEIEFMACIQSQLKSEKIESPTEWGLARLKQSIEKEEHTQPSITEKTRPTIKPIWKKLAIAASFAFVIQSGYLAQQQFSSDAAYRPLSTKTIGNSIQIQFKDGISEKDIRLLLVGMKGNIVKGPSALGIYSIQFDNNETALSILNNNEIIEYAALAE